MGIPGLLRGVLLGVLLATAAMMTAGGVRAEEARPEVAEGRAEKIREVSWAKGRERAVEEARKDLRQQGLEPDRYEVKVSEAGKADRFFGSKPVNDFWRRGREKVGEREIYVVTWSLKKKSLGGVHRYFFDAKEHSLLWVARSR